MVPFRGKTFLKHIGHGVADDAQQNGNGGENNFCQRMIGLNNASSDERISPVTCENCASGCFLPVQKNHSRSAYHQCEPAESMHVAFQFEPFEKSRTVKAEHHHQRHGGQGKKGINGN